MTTQTQAREGYELAVQRDVIAQHFLTVPDPGPEGELHSHQYRLEIRFSGAELGEYGYLVDIDAVNEVLDQVQERYGDAVLNDLPEFDGNPSVERFARNVGDRIETHLEDPTPERLSVRIWEDEEAWASHERALGE